MKNKKSEEKDIFEDIFNGKFLSIYTDGEAYFLQCYLGSIFLLPEDFKDFMNDVKSLYTSYE